MTARYWCEFAWIGDQVRADVLVTVEDGRFTDILEDAAPAGERLPGLTFPGVANAHSHAFHRALRGRTGHGSGSFWTWRDAMYSVAAVLDPDTCFGLARAVYAEMALAGVTCVGEFHYLHHGPGGTPYDDPNAMGAALMAAASEAGLRITLLDTCYLTSTVDGQPLAGPQLRFGDGSADGWAERVSALRPAGPWARIGAAAHSVRAVPARALPVVAGWASEKGAPVHVHVSEQPAENEASLAHHGSSPTGVLADAGFLGPTTTAVHATHLTDADRAALGGSRTAVCLCPTTERDLADGLGQAAALADAGSPLCLGSDSHAVIDPFEEARGMELHERLRTGRRGLFPPAALVRALAPAGHAALGWPDAGTIAVGARADLVTVALDSARTTGCRPPEAVFAATAADVRHVMVDGRFVVRDGQHVLVHDVPRALGDAISAVLP